MSEERIYKKTAITDLTPEDTYIKVDSVSFRRPAAISLDRVGDILKVVVKEKMLQERNVTSLAFEGQDENPELPPNTFGIVPKTHIAVDENYLYVWIPSLSRWKRMMLSDWEAPGALAP